MNSPGISQKPNSISKEIDLIKALKTIWTQRSTILKFIFISGFIGIVIAILTPKEYTSYTSMVPQTSQTENKLGGLSSLAMMAGLNLNVNVGGDALSPIVYPQIVQSVPFQLDLMNIPFNFTGIDHRVTLYEYYASIYRPSLLSQIAKYTIGLPRIILNSFKTQKSENNFTTENAPLQLTNKQENVRKIIAEKVILNLKAQQGFLTIQASFPEALLSAQVADQARELLQKYITQFKVEKAKLKLAFVEAQYIEKKKEFESAQEKLAQYRDQNKHTSSNLARTEEDRLQGEFTIALNVFSDISQQLEQSKIQVKEETPVFTILQPAIIPFEKSKPEKAKIVFTSILIGLLIGILYIYSKGLMKELRIKWEKTD